MLPKSLKSTAHIAPFCLFTGKVSIWGTRGWFLLFYKESLAIPRFLGVEEKIRYMTFDELCEERLAHIRQASKELIESGKVTTARWAVRWICYSYFVIFTPWYVFSWPPTCALQVTRSICQSRLPHWWGGRRFCAKFLWQHMGWGLQAHVSSGLGELFLLLARGLR